MAAITICSDFGAPQNKVWHCFPIYFPWSSLTGDQIETPALKEWSLNHWTTREVLEVCLLVRRSVSFLFIFFPKVFCILLRIKSTHTQLGVNSGVHKSLIGLFSKLPIFGGLSGAFQSSDYKPETYPPLLQTSWNCTDIWGQGGAEQRDKKVERSRDLSPLSWDYTFSDQRGTFFFRVLGANGLLLLLLSLSGDIFSTSDSVLEDFLQNFFCLCCYSLSCCRVIWV